MNKRERLIWGLEWISRLALWIVMISFGYGILLWTVNYVGNPDIMVHIRICVGSVVVLIFALFFIFLADEMGMEPF